MAEIAVCGLCLQLLREADQLLPREVESLGYAVPGKDVEREGEISCDIVAGANFKLDGEVRPSLALARVRQVAHEGDAARDDLHLNFPDSVVGAPSIGERAEAYPRCGRASASDHPLHDGPCRLAEIRAHALVVLLAVAAAPMAGALLSIVILMVRR